jgi:hypothetical protein
MSTELKVLKNTGSRGVDMQVTKYSGGKQGVCFQLTADQEEGGVGYIQLNKKDLIQIINLWEQEKV